MPRVWTVKDCLARYRHARSIGDFDAAPPVPGTEGQDRQFPEDRPRSDRRRPRDFWFRAMNRAGERP